MPVSSARNVIILKETDAHLQRQECHDPREENDALQMREEGHYPREENDARQQRGEPRVEMKLRTGLNVPHLVSKIEVAIEKKTKRKEKGFKEKEATAEIVEEDVSGEQRAHPLRVECHDYKV